MLQTLAQPITIKLLATGIFFTLGFLTTNMAFQAAAPTYVETLKAAEPISSAIVAVFWGLETLTGFEVLGLLGIISGVLVSTTSTSSSDSTTSSRTRHENGVDATASSSPLVWAACIVLTSNLCFSFRGLSQKLFRQALQKVNAQIRKANAAQLDDDTTTNATPSIRNIPSGEGGGGDRRRQPTTTQMKDLVVLDDVNLQFRMQQTGIILLLLPTLWGHGYGMFVHGWTLTTQLAPAQSVHVLARYLGWSLINGGSFSAYNLASTYLLTRISVVQHAALNCTRRIVAIVLTGFLFHIPFTPPLLGGITLSFLSFLLYTYAKTTKTTTTKKQTAHRHSQYHHDPARTTEGSATTSSATTTAAFVPRGRPRSWTMEERNRHAQHPPRPTTVLSSSWSAPVPATAHPRRHRDVGAGGPPSPPHLPSSSSSSPSPIATDTSTTTGGSNSVFQRPNRRRRR